MKIALVLLAAASLAACMPTRTIAPDPSVVAIEAALEDSREGAIQPGDEAMDCDQIRAEVVLNRARVDAEFSQAFATGEREATMAALTQSAAPVMARLQRLNELGQAKDCDFSDLADD